MKFVQRMIEERLSQMHWKERDKWEARWERTKVVAGAIVGIVVILAVAVVVFFYCTSPLPVPEGEGIGPDPQPYDWWQNP